MKKEEIPWKKHLIVGLSVLLILILLITAYLIFRKETPTCGDETLYDECSLRKPYYCSNGILVANASLCGCPESLTMSGNECISQYQAEPKEISLKYILRGEENEINFVVYKKLYDYLSKLSRSISYSGDEEPSLLDFKLKKIDEKEQRELLLQLVTEIQNLAGNKEDQARIAISIVQMIPFGASNKTIRFGNSDAEYSRYPYEVLYDMQGICSEKSELLVFLLREIGYGSAFLYYQTENHEAAGIKCPKGKGVDDSEYCFIETTAPSILTDDETEYSGVNGKLTSIPEIINVSEGLSLGKWLYEYGDARSMMNIRRTMQEKGMVNTFQYNKYLKLQEKYGLINPDEYVFE